MSRECTLKEAYIIKALDEIQPSWRNGEDVVLETKNKIWKRIAEKYSEFIDANDIACISHRSIEKTVARIREKLKIPSRMDSIKKLHTPIQASDISLQSVHINEKKEGSAVKSVFSETVCHFEPQTTISPESEPCGVKGKINYCMSFTFEYVCLKCGCSAKFLIDFSNMKVYKKTDNNTYKEMKFDET